MTNYSIVRIGQEYVVQADEQSVLKVASRRRAAKLVSVAAELRICILSRSFRHWRKSRRSCHRSSLMR